MPRTKAKPRFALTEDVVTAEVVTAEAITAEAITAEKAMAVILRRGEQGPAMAVEFVTERDCVDARAELWFEAFLRKGHLDVPLEVVHSEPEPVHHQMKDGVRICSGFRLSTQTPSEDSHSCLFARSCLEPVASRMARRLIEAGQLEAGEPYFYELHARRAEGFQGLNRAAKASAAIVVAGAQEREPFAVLRTPLAPLLEGAEEVNAQDGVQSDYPVFFTRAAREKAEAAARKGAHPQPAVETGGLFVGPLCSCPETGEMFAVVVDVLEATHSENTKYSLTYSGKTWARIQAVMNAKRAFPATQSHRLLGQVHGHSFLPMEGAEPCAVCASVEVCDRTTAWLSAEDLAWCRAVFRAEPWQLSQVFGLNARAEGVEAFYGQCGGRLVPRSYFLIDNFDH